MTETSGILAHPRDDRVDPEWSNDEVWDMILSGCDEPGDHADPSNFDPDALLDFWTTDVMLCPLHLVPEYPKVPSGVWSRQTAHAEARLRELTKQHTGKTSDALAFDTDLGDDETVGHLFHATADELDDIWQRYPHSSWWLEKMADEGMVDIQVVEA